MMPPPQVLFFAILAATILMFVWGRWRHDMVALGSLLACVAAGLVPAAEAFAGFGHPAVITVACVLVLSRGLQNSGAVDVLAQRVLPSSTGPTVAIAALTGLAAVLSAFMNNVGALALLLPVALQMAAKQKLPPGKVLMPLAFGSILGGTMTMIGTPPNLIVAGFRAEATDVGAFTMFDFTPVGVMIAAAGIVFVALTSRWLVPTRERTGVEGFDAGAYLTEARIPEKTKVAGKTLAEIEESLDEVDAQVVGIVRREVRLPSPSPHMKLWPGDILVIEAEPEALASGLSALGLKLEEDVRDEAAPAADDANPTAPADASEENQRAAPEDEKSEKEASASGEVELTELVVMPGSAILGRSATDIQLRTRFGINMLAISRQGSRSTARLRKMSVRAGDVLLMQGVPEGTSAFAATFGCIPLATRSLRIPDRSRALLATAIMALAIAGPALGLVSAAVSFAAGVLAVMAFRVVPPRAVYESIDWPVIVLLGALIPVAGAMASTGAADALATWLLESVAQGHPVAAVGVILVVTMTLSDFMNNAATAAVMCPIAIGSAAQAGTSADPFLMAVAVGASCAFLTPIGHQNNTIILGPGGLRFGDYWRLGLPLEIIIVAVGLPVLLLVWPL